MQSNKLWTLIGLASLCASVFLLLGFGYAAVTLLHPAGGMRHYTATSPPGEAPSSPLAASSEILVAAIGDSLTKGTGDSTGEGYVKQLIRDLQAETNKPVKLINNLAINGQRTDQLKERLQQESYGRALKQANLILLSIGGNDLFRMARETLESDGSKRTGSETLEERLPEGLAGLGAILRLLHDINPNAQVVYVGLYNPFYDIEQLRAGSLQVAEWNSEAYAMIQKYDHMLMVPTYDLFESRIGAYLSSDHFHPNHEGYARIAERIAQSLNVEGG